MDLHLLRSFVAVADEEHLARAAAQLGVSASPLSRQIRALEGTLGLTLFTRERQRLRLTASGRWLRERARDLLDQAERVRRDAAGLARGQTGALAVGFIGTALWNDLLPNALAAFHRARPDVRIELRHQNSAAQLEGLRTGRLDLAFVHAAREAPDLAFRLASSEPMLLALPRTHAFARRRHITAADLDGLRWIVLGGDGAARVRERLAAFGFQPDVVFEASDLATMLRLVEAGLGASILPATARRRASASVTFRTLPWLNWTTTIYLASRTSGRSAAADAFASFVSDAPA